MNVEFKVDLNGTWVDDKEQEFEFKLSSVYVNVNLENDAFEYVDFSDDFLTYNEMVNDYVGYELKDAISDYLYNLFPNACDFDFDYDIIDIAM